MDGYLAQIMLWGSIFALPDLRGRIAIAPTSQFLQGTASGSPVYSTFGVTQLSELSDDMTRTVHTAEVQTVNVNLPVLALNCIICTDGYYPSRS